MSYRQIKWLIIIVPMLTIEIWELVRHDYLQDFISMETGNWLSAVIILAVSLLLSLKLFAVMENMQGELNRERAQKTILVERERIAKELHDGIAQSLFLLSVKIHQLDSSELKANQLHGLKDIIRRVHDDVRQSIQNLRLPLNQETAAAWGTTITLLVSTFEQDTGIPVSLQWDLADEIFSTKEKVEITACLREALMNIQKHAYARNVWIRFGEDEQGWYLVIEDDGKGFAGDPFGHAAHYGINMMQERAEAMGWQLSIERKDGLTRVELRKGI